MDKIQEIFTAPWAIADNDYYRLLSLLVPCVAAGNLDAIEKRLDNNKITAYATTPYLANRWELDDDTLPADSVAVIILEGTLYSWETYRLEKQLRDVFDNPKICGAVLWINGPGGMVAHVDLAAKMIAESSKPIATYVAGTMGSAHFWLGTAAGRTFIASPMCEVGSVGIMLTYQSFKNYFKKQGIDYREIYPDSADLKNYETRAIEDDNNEEPKATSGRHAPHFLRCDQSESGYCLRSGTSPFPGTDIHRRRSRGKRLYRSVRYVGRRGKMGTGTGYRQKSKRDV